MADFDQFESPAGQAPAQTTEEDPAAEFLAREQNELAGIEDENFGIDSSPAVVSDPTPQSNDLDPLAGSLQPSNDFDFLADTPQEPSDVDPLAAGMADDKLAGDVQTNGPSDMYSAISHADTRANEPEKIRLWREEQKERLAKKDEDADQLEIEWKETAKKEVADWYTRQDELMIKAKASNRSAEEAFIKDRDEVTPGQEWERIARLCDFNPKNSKNTKDVTRFRSILLHLKQSGLAQPTAAK